MSYWIAFFLVVALPILLWLVGLVYDSSTASYWRYMRQARKR